MILSLHFQTFDNLLNIKYCIRIHQLNLYEIQMQIKELKVVYIVSCSLIFKNEKIYLIMFAIVNITQKY